jgi:hypothetical protein
VTNPLKFKAPDNPNERIWQEADRLRTAPQTGGSLPVKAIKFAEFAHGPYLIIQQKEGLV